MALAGAIVLLAGLFWCASSFPGLWSTILRRSATPSDTLSRLTRAFPPQETSSVVRDSGPPASASTPLPLREPAQRGAFPQTAPGVVRTVQPGDQLAKVARDVYGVSNQAVLAWIKQNNPRLQNVNRIDVGMPLLFPPLPVSSSRQGQSARHDP